MRIAIVSTPFVRVPPSGYGGTELFCGCLAEALFRRGHDVTLFATGDSTCSGDLASYFPEPRWPPSVAADLAHVRFALREVSRDPRGYDAVQINSAVGLGTARELGIPVVYTLHHARSAELSRIYDAHPEVRYVAVSRRQLEGEVPLSNAVVIHHGVVPDAYPLALGPRSYVLHLGRFAPEKGTHLAIDAARLASTPIVVAGRLHPEGGNQAYYDAELASRFSSAHVRVVGEADHPSKVSLLGRARALLCPIQWEEPFGLIAVEAMLTGTPVIGFPRGAFPEIIEEGVTGMLVEDVAQMSRAIERAARWDRRRCAARAAERFSADRMAAEYEALFAGLSEESALGREERAIGPPGLDPGAMPRSVYNSR